MRKLFALVICLLMLPCITTVASAEEKKGDQKTEQKTDQKKDDKKSNDKEKKGEEPVLIVVYEYAWPPKMR